MIRAEDLESSDFPTVRRGYDPESVDRVIAAAARTIAELEQRARIATVRAERLMAEVNDLRHRSDLPAETYAESLIAREQILADAEARAARIIAEAEGAASEASPGPDGMDGREPTIGGEDLRSTDAEAQAIIRAAEAEAEAILDEARRESRQRKADADRELGELIERIRMLRSRVEAVEGTSVGAVDLTDLEKETIDLRSRSEGIHIDDDRTTRYRSRSAGLPRIGATAGSVLTEMANLRVEDDD